MDEQAFNQFRADYSVAELERKFEKEEAAKARGKVLPFVFFARRFGSSAATPI